MAQTTTTSEYTTVVVEVERDRTGFGGGVYRIECTCGERVEYRGEQFTAVEARRHRAWHDREAARRGR